MMWRVTWMAAGVFFALAVTPIESRGQVQEEADDFVNDFVMALWGPNLNFSAHGGLTSNGRMLLQNVNGGQRELIGTTGFNVGVGVGVDLLLRNAVRLAYTYGQNDLEYQTDNGDGSEALDIEDIASISTHAVALDLLRYMLPSRAAISPYASAGVTAIWWDLGEPSSLVDAGSGSTQFRTGWLASVGLQVKLLDRTSARLEGVWSDPGNPFTGSDSFRTLSGATIDEPDRVSRRDYRFAVVYHLSSPPRPAVPRP